MPKLRPTRLTTNIYLLCLVTFLAACLMEASGQDNERQKLARRLAPVFDENVIVFGHLNLNQVDLDQVEKKLGQWLDMPATGWLKRIRPIRQSILSAGGSHVFVIFSMTDFSATPIVAMPVAREFDASLLIPALGPAIGKDLKASYLEDSRLAILASEQAVNRIQKGNLNSRKDVAELMNLISDETASLNFVPSLDHLRVMREFEPQFSEPFSEFDGELLGNSLRSASLVLKKIQPLDLKLNIRSANVESATKLKNALARVIGSLPGEGPDKGIFRKLEKALVISNTSPGLNLKVGANDEDEWKKTLLPFFSLAKREVQQGDEVRNLKLILLGMHNFHDAFRGFPDLGRPSDKGRPGLSWRVHILPFIEQAELYEQFKLDEPWNSKHNLKLITKMPDVYRVAGKDLDGKTTVVMPRGKGFFAKPFLKKDEQPKGKVVGRTFRDILDGTSNSIAVLRVNSNNAVVWTKPQDWEPDKDNLVQPLQEDGREKFIFATADGAVHQVRWSNVTAKKLMAWLTIAGEEFVQFD